jgi:hypothetical protein
MTIFIYFGMFLFVGGLLLFAVLGIWLPGFATGRIVMGALVVLISLSEMINAQSVIAKKEQAFKRGDWATATVVRAIVGLHAPPVVTLRVHGPDCEFEQTEQVTGDFIAVLECVPGTDCPTEKVVRVVLGEPPCSIAYADPRGGILDQQLLTWASAVAALAGLVFIWSGFRFRRKR